MLTIIIATILYLVFGIWALIIGRVLVEEADSWWKRNLIPVGAWLFWPAVMVAGIVVLCYIIANK
jgi:hypothetical protein